VLRWPRNYKSQEAAKPAVNKSDPSHDVTPHDPAAFADDAQLLESIKLRQQKADQ
jgi:hypothetical protein